MSTVCTYIRRYQQAEASDVLLIDSTFSIYSGVNERAEISECETHVHSDAAGEHVYWMHASHKSSIVFAKGLFDKRDDNQRTTK